MRAAALFLACSTLAACRKPAPSVERRPTPAAALSTASVAATTSAARAGPLPPLLGVAWIEHLDLASGHEAFVTPPLGAREPRPLIVAVHGAGDRAEWACGGWRMVASEYAFVVCPQGLKMDALRFGWDSASTIRLRVAAAIAAARVRFGEYIADGPTLYVGFSQGATLAAPTLLDPSQPFPLVAFAEGGYGLVQSDDVLRRLRQRGVERVLLACGTAACFSSMKAARPRFERLGIDVTIGGDPAAGHNLNGEMQAGLRRVWPGFVAGLPNWRGFPGR